VLAGGTVGYQVDGLNMPFMVERAGAVQNGAVILGLSVDASARLEVPDTAQRPP
jgi:hypothetical protein